MLLDAGDFKAADALYGSRLENGDVFKWIPAAAEGLGCALGFVRDEGRREQCEQQLSRRRLGFYLMAIGFFASHTGHYEHALRYYGQSNDGKRELQDARNLSIGLHNEAQLLVFLGRLSDARRAASEALRLATEEGDEKEIRNNHCYRGWVRPARHTARPRRRPGAARPRAPARSGDRRCRPCPRRRRGGAAPRPRLRLRLGRPGCAHPSKPRRAPPSPPGTASAATRERETSRRARADAEALAARLVLSEEDLAAANAKALEWLRDWEKNAKK